MRSKLRDVEWVGTSLNDLKELPDLVRQEIGYTLYEIQKGKKPMKVKPFKGFESGIMEMVSDFNKNTYRAVYALKLSKKIFVLHVFQKKSKIGIKTPKADVDLIRRRLLRVRQLLSGE